MSNMTDQELLDAFADGATERHIVKLAMRGKRFVIFHIPGHKYWAGKLNPSAYAKAGYILIEQGQWIMRGKRIREWEGRVSKKELQKALDEAEKGENQ